MASLASASGKVEPDTVFLTPATVVMQGCSRLVQNANATRGHPLNEIEDLRLQQGLIIKDLLFCLLGCEGFYIRYSSKYDDTNVDMKIHGPEFKTAKNLDISLKIVTKKLVRFGKYYSGLVSFVEHYNNQKFGKVVQRLCLVICQFISYYREIVLKLEEEFNFNSNFNLTIFESMINEEISNKIIHLYEIALEIHSVTQEKQDLHVQEQNQFLNFVTSVKTSLEHGDVETSVSNSLFSCCKGGMVLHIVQTRINAYKGDSQSLQYLTSVFDAISEDYVYMLNDWLMNGEIDDPYDEFLIKKKDIPPNLMDIFNYKSEHYWNELFVIRTDNTIEQLSGRQMQNRILNTGKLLNIFKKCTGLHNFESLKETKLAPIKVLLDLELKVNIFHKRANRLFLKLIFDGFHFPTMLDQLQSLFLFNDCYHIDSFIELCFQELKKNKGTISVSNLRRRYDDRFRNDKDKTTHTSTCPINNVLTNNQKFTIASSNFYEVSAEIMNVQAFDTKRQEFLNEPSIQNLLNITFEKHSLSAGDQNLSTNYDRFHVDDYTIASVDLTVDLPFPLNLVINRELGYHYELMFKLLMIIKFAAKFNEVTWNEMNYSTIWKYKNFDRKILTMIKRCRILNNSIGNFMNELLYYLNFDVIELNFNNLEQALENIQTKLATEELDFSETTSNAYKGFGYSQNSYGNFKNTNSIFDDMISNQQKEHKTHQTKDITSVEYLISTLGDYLNTIVNDALITKPVLLNLLKRLLDIIILVNHYLNSMKKKLILCNFELYEQFSTDYPNKFDGQSMDNDLVRQRFDRTNEILTQFMTQFNDCLAEFVTALKRYGETETKLVLILGERLQSSFMQ
jgi:gamma-tubulin complex component 2